MPRPAYVIILSGILLFAFGMLVAFQGPAPNY
jgi:hypothetical protein